MSKREIDFILTIDSSKFGRAINTAQTKVDRMAKSISSGMGKAAASTAQFTKNLGLMTAAAGTAAAAAGLYKLNQIRHESVELANIQEAAEVKLAAVLNATGQAAGYNLDQLKAQAGEMQGMTTVGDEVIINAQAILATFKEIKGDNFRDATQAALDMSAVLGQDLNTSILQIGKALNDPVKGMTALTRSGVSFTDQQKEVVKQLVATGDVAGAQAVILQEMAAQFGGAAAAQRETFDGMKIAAENAYGDVLEEIGFVITKNQFFIEALGLVEQKFVDLGKYVRENRAELIEWSKQGTLGSIDIADGILTFNDYIYRGFSGLQGLFQGTAASALYVSGGIFKIVQGAAALTDQLHITRGAAQRWGTEATAAFGAADKVMSDAAANFNDMANGSSTIHNMQSGLAGFRSELEGIDAVEVDPGAKIAASMQKGMSDAEQAVVGANSIWVSSTVAATDDMKKAYKKYVDEVKRLQDEITSREQSLQEQLRAMSRSGMDDYSAWRDRKQEAQEYYRAAKQAAAAGNFSQAVQYADQAKTAYADLNEEVKVGDKTMVSQQQALQAAMAGVKKSGELATNILKKQKEAAEGAAKAIDASVSDNLAKDFGVAELSVASLDETTGKYTKTVVKLGDKWVDVWKDNETKAMGTLNAVGEKIEALDGTVIEVKINEVVAKAAGGLIQHLATGGQVWRNITTGGRLPGFGGGDRVPVMAEAGEVMINKFASKAAGYRAALAFNAQRWDIVIQELLKRFSIPGVLKARTGGEIGAGRLHLPQIPPLSMQHLTVGGITQPVAAGTGNITNLTIVFPSTGNAVGPFWASLTRAQVRALEREQRHMSMGRSA